MEEGFSFENPPSVMGAYTVFRNDAPATRFQRAPQKSPKDVARKGRSKCLASGAPNAADASAAPRSKSAPRNA